jgi:hypothetical protein
MGLQSELLGRLDEFRKVGAMMQAPWKTCSDEWAQDIQRHQENAERQREIESVRSQVRKGIASMKENDELFLRAFVSVLVEDLK